MYIISYRFFYLFFSVFIGIFLAISGCVMNQQESTPEPVIELHEQLEKEQLERENLYRQQIDFRVRPG